MTEIVTLELSDKVAQRAKEIAALTHRQLEDVLLEWLDRAISETPVESLADEQVLALCDLQMQAEQQEIFSDLLARNREGQIDRAEACQLDELMQVYRHGLIRKAKALKVAVERGLKPALT